MFGFILQGGSTAGERSLTAFVLAALLEAKTVPGVCSFQNFHKISLQRFLVCLKQQQNNNRYKNIY